MLKNNNLIKLSVNQLIFSGLHIGQSKPYETVTESLKAYLTGHYNSFYIINLYYTNYQLRLIVNLIINLIMSKQKIFLLKSTGFQSFTKKFYELSTNDIYIYDYKWVRGFFTNFKYVRYHFINKDYSVRRKSKIKLNKKQRLQLARLIFLPSLIFSFDNNNIFALEEAALLDIPIAGILNSQSLNCGKINYLIMGNNTLKSSMFLYYNIIYNSILLGIQKERFSVLSLNKKKF